MARICIGNRVKLQKNGATGVVSGYVVWEDAKRLGVFKRDPDSVEVTWDATGETTAEWKADLIRTEKR